MVADTCGRSVNGTDYNRLRPTQDRRGLNRDYCFGSTHTDSLNMVFRDGSVRPVRYEIEPRIHALLGNRKDGQATDGAGLWIGRRFEKCLPSIGPMPSVGQAGSPPHDVARQPLQA